MSAGIDGAVGMMDGAYFTSRSEIIDFLNDLLQLNLSKIEQTASGAVACQLTEYMFPGSIPMKRVNWEAKSQHEFVQNYKLLQAAFSKNRVQRYVDVDKLIRAKYQDNLEFCQWLKAFFDRTNPAQREDYDPVAVRAKGKGGRNLPEYFDGSKKSTSKRTSRTTTSRNPAPTRRPMAPKKENIASESTTPCKRTQSNTSNPSSLSSKGSGASPSFSKPHSSGAAIVADATLMKENADLESRNAELMTQLAEVEKERDFYFDKLRDVEMLLQIKREKGTPEKSEVLHQRLFQVLYATGDEKVIVDEESGEACSPESDNYEQPPLNDIKEPMYEASHANNDGFGEMTEKENINVSISEEIDSLLDKTEKSLTMTTPTKNHVDSTIDFLEEFFGSPAPVVN